MRRALSNKNQALSKRIKPKESSLLEVALMSLSFLIKFK